MTQETIITGGVPASQPTPLGQGGAEIAKAALSTDGTLAANSDVLVPSQKAVATAIATLAATLRDSY